MNQISKPNYIPLVEPIALSEQQWPAGTTQFVSIRCLTYNHELYISDAIEVNGGAVYIDK